MVKLLMAAGGLVAALALFVTLYYAAGERGREVHCRNNLRQLGTLAVNSWPLIDSSKTGRAFWHEVRVAVYRDLNGKWKSFTPDPFICPVHGKTASDRESAQAIDYRGPKKTPDELKAYGSNAPLGADRPGNHPSGGWVLRLDTSVDALPPLIGRAVDGDALWNAAADALSD
jgi:hypothetical protein